MFLLYHSEGCNICELVPYECYINDLYTTTCSGMLGHHNGDEEGLKWRFPSPAGCQKELLDPPDLTSTTVAACSMFSGKEFGHLGFSRRGY
jgi:hypothetical protein